MSVCHTLTSPRLRAMGRNTGTLYALANIHTIASGNCLNCKSLHLRRLGYPATLSKPVLHSVRRQEWSVAFIFSHLKKSKNVEHKEECMDSDSLCQK